VVTLEGLVFDLDGTLVDSRLDLAAAVNRMRQEIGLPELDTALVVTMIGDGARELVRRALAVDHADGLLEELYPSFLAHYGELCLEQTHPYPGIPELLSRVAPRCPLGVLTNKPGAFTLHLLQGLELAPFFAAVVAGDSLPTRKPDPEGFFEIARRLGLPPGRCLMVGDSAIDAATAGAAGAPFALCEWGFAPEGVSDGAADVRVATPAELAAWLDKRVGNQAARARGGVH
jgi:phosphoglycolate phosphatase